MKNMFMIFISLLTVSYLGEAQIQSPIKIMPLGNSITQLDWQGGYRRLLKDSLVLGGFSTDFVGSNNYGQANWANPDYEHEGYNSATITRAAGSSYPHIETATSRMVTYQPEIVIVELGTNDLHSGGRTPAMFRDDMRKLLDTIWSVNPGIKIVLNTIPPPDTIGHSNFVPLWYNVIATNALFPGLISEKVAQGKTIVLADVYASFMPPESVKAYILDGVHPSYDGWNGHPVGGYRRMAKAIYPRVKELINGAPVSVKLLEEIPDNFFLYDNYPNPFNPETNIEYRISAFAGASADRSNISAEGGGFITLKIFDMLGQNIATLVNEAQQPGFYSVNWNANQLPSGVYYYRLTAGEYIETKRLLLLK